MKTILILNMLSRELMYFIAALNIQQSRFRKKSTMFTTCRAKWHGVFMDRDKNYLRIYIFEWIEDLCSWYKIKTLEGLISTFDRGIVCPYSINLDAFFLFYWESVGGPLFTSLRTKYILNSLTYLQSPISCMISSLHTYQSV